MNVSPRSAMPIAIRCAILLLLTLQEAQAAAEKAQADAEQAAAEQAGFNAAYGPKS